LKLRRHLHAWPAPGRPEIDKHRDRRIPNQPIELFLVPYIVSNALKKRLAAASAGRVLAGGEPRRWRSIDGAARRANNCFAGACHRMTFLKL
jgi:hypothetical protein